MFTCNEVGCIWNVSGWECKRKEVVGLIESSDGTYSCKNGVIKDNDGKEISKNYNFTAIPFKDSVEFKIEEEEKEE